MRVVEAAGRAAFPGFRLRVLERTPSTQDVVRAAARAGAEGGFCCVAMAQSAGRGRQGRVWEAEPGAGLLMSVLLRVQGDVVGGVPLAAGVAVVDAVRGLGVPGGVVGVKWPNDVLVEGRGKLAGILAEVEPAARHRDGGPHADGLPAPQGSSAAAPKELGPHAGGLQAPHDSSAASPKELGGGREGSLFGQVAVALGIGVNLAIEAFPPSVEGASLHTLLGRAVPWHEALAAVLQALGDRVRELEAGGIPATAASWREYAVGLGGLVQAHTPTGLLRGTALDIADDGALLIETPAGITRLLAGDVHLERPD